MLDRQAFSSRADAPSEWPPARGAVRPRDVLHAQLAQLAEHFALEVVAALRRHPLEELTTLLPGARPSRRTATLLDDTAADIASLLAGHPQGLRSYEIQRALGISRRRLVRPLLRALATKTIVKRGQTQGTRYFATRHQ